jgi:uncharacterized protein (DUF2235 family)
MSVISPPQSCNETMRRQIVVCCDGTNNTLTGGHEDTNVVILHNHLAAQNNKPGFRRLLYYDPGVGSSGLLPPVGPVDWLARNWQRLSGLASGGGVFDNIAEAYLFLMRNWRDDGDEIYLFGFSRGAFTVRAVAGMVNLFGIVRPEYEALLPTLVHLYFAPSRTSPAGPLQHLTRSLHATTSRTHAAAAETGGHAKIVPPGDNRALLAEEVRRHFAGPLRRDAWVHWIGVWDTVESVGLPGPLSQINPGSPSFENKRFRHARHALALDEHRWPFLPRLYAEPGDIVGARSLKQRWFPGVHCDVGGSYPQNESGVSESALRWMIDEVAGELGIIPWSAATPKPMWRHDPLWEMPYWALAGMTVRNMCPRLEHRDGPPLPFQAIAGVPNAADPAIRSIWERRRATWPLVATCVAGILALMASGLCLLPGAPPLSNLSTWMDALSATRDFAGKQFDAVHGEGLFSAGSRLWDEPLRNLHTGWAMFWDLGFIACWGYWMARICSRAFTWMVGERHVDSERPWWLPLGFAPMAAVSGDVIEDMAIWLALALHAAGVDTLALAAVCLGGVASLLKWIGLAFCAVLAVVRFRLVFGA